MGSDSKPSVIASWNTTSLSVEPDDLGELGGVDREHEVTPQQMEVGDEAVVHEQPFPRRKGWQLVA